MRRIIVGSVSPRNVNARGRARCIERGVARSGSRTARVWPRRGDVDAAREIVVVIVVVAGGDVKLVARGGNKEPLRDRGAPFINLDPLVDNNSAAEDDVDDACAIEIFHEYLNFW